MIIIHSQPKKVKWKPKTKKRYYKFSTVFKLSQTTLLIIPENGIASFKKFNATI